MKKILWLSQHEPLPCQKAELNKLFGSVQLCRDVNSFSNAQEIKERFENGGYDDVVLVAPLSVFSKLCELGVKPLYAVMEQMRDAKDAHLTFRGRHYRFACFKRVKAVRLEFEEV